MKRFILYLGIFFMAASAPLISQELDFIPATDPRLNQGAEPLTIDELQSEKIQNLIHDMLYLSGYNADRKKTKKQYRLVGLAAPQIGVMKQIIVIDAAQAGSKLPEFEVLINPQIIWESSEKQELPQGCYSVPSCYVGVVERSTAVVVRALRPDGTSFQKRYEGYPSHVVQHEIDHLHGIRFPQRLNSHEKLHFLENSDKDLPEYRKSWKNWSQCVSPETFDQFNSGHYSAS